MEDLDVYLLRRVSGKLYRTEVEFEDQCALRSYRFKGLYAVKDGRVVLTSEGAATARIKGKE